MEDWETRCYAITTDTATLDALEGVLKRIEDVAARRQLRLVSVFVDCRAGIPLAVRRLAGWVEEEDAEPPGSPLPELRKEDQGTACYVHDV